MDTEKQKAFIAAAHLEMDYCAENIEYFIDEYGYVQDLDADDGKSQFKLWSEQKRALREIMENRLTIVLKARQLGFTWLALWISLHFMMFKVGFTVVGLSKTEFDVKELINRLVFMLRHLPSWMIRNTKDGAGITGLSWSNTALTVTIHRDGEKSRFIGMTSTPDAGRSFTAGLIVLDEWAYQPWAEEVWVGGFPTINRPTGGKFIGLSTAKRITLFHKIWDEAKQRGFHRIFLSWRADPRRDEKWYQATLAAMGKDKTRQDYPDTAEEAFSAGSDTSFPEFSPSIHVCEPFTIPEHWYKWMSVDNGYNDPFAWYWYAVSEDGVVYVYREYSRSREDPQIYYTDQGKRVSELTTYTKLDPFGNPEKAIEDISYIVAGLDAWSRHHRDKSGKNLIDYYREGGADFAGYTEAVTDRKLRKATVHEYLKPTFDERTQSYHTKVKIFSTCKHLIESLGAVTNDPKDPEKVMDSDIDNQYDSFGYGLISHHRRKSKTVEKPKTEAQKHKERKMRELQRRNRYA